MPEGVAGSSPLARGLHPRILDPRHPGRIIPARAGFTREVGDGLSVPWDHPRSRGVYDNEPLKGIHLDGSSPLARGLRVGIARLLVGYGIIPARAGFTRSWKFVTR